MDNEFKAFVSILIVVEYALKDLYDFPVSEVVEGVSILIVVEYALKDVDEVAEALFPHVSILIVVEYALKALYGGGQLLDQDSLNPYCCGICPKSVKVRK